MSFVGLAAVSTCEVEPGSSKLEGTAFVVDGTNAQACKGMALCFEALGDKPQARACWERYIKTGPDNEELEEIRERLEDLKE